MITVCIASYKYGHLAGHAIDSVLCQTKPVDKIIVVDDGVGDLAIVKEKYPEKFIKWIYREKNMGTAANFNDVLLNHINTDQAMFLGADNYLRPDTIEKLSKHKADIISYDIALFGTEVNHFKRKVGAVENGNGYPIWRFKKGNIHTGNYIHGSSLYNAKMAKRFGYKPSGGSNSEEDYMLWRAMLDNGATHIHVPEPMLYYRRHKHNFIQPRR